MVVIQHDGGPAFPTPMMPGMTLLDYFAAQALAGLLASLPEDDQATRVHEVVFTAYALADEMLRVRAAREGAG
jgi:hypothetical protein